MQMTRAKCNRVTHTRLLEVVNYDPDTGVFTSLVKRGNVGIGRRLGHKNSTGYLQLMIDGQHFCGHVLAFFYMTGEWPQYEIDHINGIRRDDRFDNLREATSSENSCNRSRRSDNTSGFKGVYFFTSPYHLSKPWRGYISVSGKRVWTDCFCTPEEAFAARCKRLAEFHGEFSRSE